MYDDGRVDPSAPGGSGQKAEPARSAAGSETYLCAKDIRIGYSLAGNADVMLAVDGIDLTVRRGEVLCVVGPSGCGKTTFLNAVAGFLPISSGELTLNGNPITKPGPDRAMVFQQPGLLPWRNVLYNVTYGLEMSGRMRRKNAAVRARELLELVGLADFARTYPHQLSGGMQQRVNLARALAVEPELLLLDEPFASVDAQTRETLQVELLGICKRANVTALFVTHDINEAVFLADRVCVFGKRPARIVREVAISLPAPRTEARLKPEFLTYVKDVAVALGSAQAERR